MWTICRTIVAIVTVAIVTAVVTGARMCWRTAREYNRSYKHRSAGYNGRWCWNQWSGCNIGRWRRTPYCIESDRHDRRYGNGCSSRDADVNNEITVICRTKTTMQTNMNSTKYVRLRGLAYIHTCRSYVQHAARFHERCISSVTFTSAHLYGNVYIPVAWPARWPIRPVLGYWGNKVHKNGRFPTFDANEPPCKIWRR